MLANSRNDYKSPKLHTNGHNTISFVKTAVEERKSGCCSTKWAYFKCAMCDIFISHDGSNITTWLLSMSVRHISSGHKHESYTIINGQPLDIWLFKLRSLLIHGERNGNKQKFVDMECTLCKYKYYTDDVEMAYGRENFKRASNEVQTFSHWLVMHLRHKMHQHFMVCDPFIAIRKEFIRNSPEERERLITEFRAQIKDARIDINNYTIDVEKYNYMISASFCQCNKSIIVTCHICGKTHKTHKRGSSNTLTYSCRSVYKKIVRKHLTNAKGSVKYDYRDIITPINKNVSINNGAHEWTHDGYKCSICGIEYEKTGNKLASMPDKLVVLAHAEKCIPGNREAIAASGRHCI